MGSGIVLYVLLPGKCVRIVVSADADAGEGRRLVDASCGSSGDVRAFAPGVSCPALALAVLCSAKR